MKNFNSVMKKVFGLGLALTLSMSMIGCGQSADVDSQDMTATIEDEKVAMSAATYFTKGVYASYAADAENPDKTYFYVFYGDGSGSIEDGVSGAATYFEYEVGYDNVTFHIGSIDPIDDVFTVKSFEDGKVIGYLGDNTIDMVFEPVEDVDVETFNAVNYVNAKNGEDFVYTDANGWSVKYNPAVIQVNQGGPVTTFVYTGDCAGTCMITATYTVDDNAKGSIKTIGDSWGSETTFTEGTFPGTEDVTGYYATYVEDMEGSGLTSTAIGRDYMDGALIFEFTVHNCGDDAIDIPVSDALSAIIDSIEFIEY